jgi:Tol biopolymer transport system component
MNADGSSQTRLAPEYGAQHNPTWSPDGRTIAFATAYCDYYYYYYPCYSTIRAVRADGTGLTSITGTEMYAISPVWRR